MIAKRLSCAALDLSMITRAFFNSARARITLWAWVAF
jgi:hypothetical protein